MNDCKHEWMIESISDVDERHMETEGYFNLTCVLCGAHATLGRPTYLECYQVTKTWLEGGYPGFTDNGDDRLVVLDDGPVLIEYPNDGDLYTIENDDNVTDVGTMGWLTSGQKSQLDGDPNDHPGFECSHAWTVRSTMYDPRAEKDFLELECDHCGAWACVHDVTSEDVATISKMWDDGLRVNWGDETRVTFSTIPPADDDNGGIVAHLVNALDLGLEVESDEDIPF